MYNKEKFIIEKCILCEENKKIWKMKTSIGKRHTGEGK